MITPATPPIGALMARARRHVIRDFIDQEATAPDRAIGYAPARRLEKQAFRHLVKAGAIREGAADTYWLNREVTDAVLARLRRRVGIGIAIGAAVAAAAALFAG